MKPQDRAWVRGPWLLFVVVTLAVGVVLRWVLSSTVPTSVLPTDFAFWRHAHSHLGYYGVLFPLAFAAWSATSNKPASRRETRFYLLCCALSFVGFAAQGYKLLSIAASSVVGAVWVVHAVRHRGFLRRRDVLAPVPLALLASVCFVPPIAVFTRRDPVLANHLVHTFLGILLLGVMAPTVFHLFVDDETRPPHLGWIGLAGAALLSVHLGPAPHVVLSLGAVLVAGVWLHTMVTSTMPWPLRLGVGATALVLLFVPAAPTPLAPLATVGALHWLILGVLLLGFAVHRWPLSTLWQLTWVATSAVLAGTLLLAALPALSTSSLQLQTVSGACGGVLLLCVGWGAVEVRRRLAMEGGSADAGSKNGDV